MIYLTLEFCIQFRSNFKFFSVFLFFCFSVFLFFCFSIFQLKTRSKSAEKIKKRKNLWIRDAIESFHDSFITFFNFFFQSKKEKKKKREKGKRKKTIQTATPQQDPQQPFTYVNKSRLSSSSAAAVAKRQTRPLWLNIAHFIFSSFSFSYSY